MIGIVDKEIAFESLTYVKAKRHFKKDPKIPVILESGKKEDPNYIKAEVCLLSVGREVCRFRVVKILDQGEDSFIVSGDTGTTAIGDLHFE